MIFPNGANSSPSACVWVSQALQGSTGAWKKVWVQLTHGHFFPLPLESAISSPMFVYPKQDFFGFPSFETREFLAVGH